MEKSLEAAPRISDAKMESNAKNAYFYNEILKFYRFLTNADQPQSAVFRMGMFMLDHGNIFQAWKQYQNFELDGLQINSARTPAKPYDFILENSLLSMSPDVQSDLRSIASLADGNTRIIVSTYNAFWEPILNLGSTLGMRSKTRMMNWLSKTDLENLFKLEGLEVISHYRRILLPKYIPVLSWLANKYLVHLPILKSLALMQYYVLRKRVIPEKAMSVSVVIPARNEKGNIENALKRMPQFGSNLEIIFVEGNSTDDTWAEIERVKQAYPQMNIVTLRQPGKGKGDAVRHGFKHATGEILMILDADLTVPPEDLPKFYDALATNVGEFINGTRLVYPMEKEAMRFLNLLGNMFFAAAFSWLLGQRFKDTLCGTKVLSKKNYEKIVANRSYFGDFDPFGDFDLLFGAAKQNLKIVEIPIRYKSRTYGETNISRFRHGLLLLQMCIYASKKFKFY